MPTPPRTDGTADALAERLFGATIDAVELLTVALGMRLGLYDVLAEAVDVTAEELANKADIHPRYAREWLEQQAVAGFLVADGDQEASRRFALPAAHRPVFADPTSPAYVSPFALIVSAVGQTLPRVVEAYRSGEGLAFSEYGDDMRHGQAAINRPAFLTDLPTVWLPAMTDVHERLTSGNAWVADVGCGVGWASIGIAQAYPGVHVDGFDLDVASIEDARRNAAEAGVDDRVSFYPEAAGAAATKGRYDLVCILEALHDMAQPVEVLRAVREMVADGGAVLVADERVAEQFTAPGDEIERMMYGWSVLHCLVAGMAEQPTAATGTVMRPAKLRDYARKAGFARVEVLDVDNDLFWLYRLDG